MNSKSNSEVRTNANKPVLANEKRDAHVQSAELVTDHLKIKANDTEVVCVDSSILRVVWDLVFTAKPAS